jgi:hypothetical protein
MVAFQHVNAVPQRQGDSFRRMMEGARPGSTVWLDNLSINQEDHNDVATQLAVMGDIYRNAKYVSVFLPLRMPRRIIALSTWLN